MSSPELTADYQAESVEVHVLPDIYQFLNILLTNLQHMAVDDGPSPVRAASPPSTRAPTRGRGGRGRGDFRVSLLPDSCTFSF